MTRTQLFQLEPNAAQLAHFRQEAGLARWAWNWCLRYYALHYALYGRTTSGDRNPAYRRPSLETLQKRWVRLKKRGSKQVPAWVRECSAYTPRTAFHDFETAFAAFLSGRSRFPGLRTRRRTRASFGVVGGTRAYLRHGRRVAIPGCGRVRVTSEFRWPSGSVRSGRVVERAGKWYLALVFDLANPGHLATDRPACGVDLGLTTLVTVAAEGGLIAQLKGVKVTARDKRKLCGLHRRLDRRSRQATGLPCSHRRDKAKLALARAYKRIADVRLNNLHHISQRLVESHSLIVLEDLPVKGLMRTPLSGAVGRAGWGTLRRLIQYKAAAAGSLVLIADRLFPSTKTCSACGHTKVKLPLEVRTYSCVCGFIANRDDNAALNLLKLGLRWQATPGGSPGVTPVEGLTSASALRRRKKPRRSG